MICWTKTVRYIYPFVTSQRESSNAPTTPDTWQKYTPFSRAVIKWRFNSLHRSKCAAYTASSEGRKMSPVFVAENKSEQQLAALPLGADSSKSERLRGE